MMLAGAALAQALDSISVAFAIDGRPARCSPFGVELKLDGKIIRPRLAVRTFTCQTLSRSTAIGEMTNTWTSASPVANTPFLFPGSILHS